MLTSTPQTPEKNTEEYKTHFTPLPVHNSRHSSGRPNSVGPNARPGSKQLSLRDRRFLGLSNSSSLSQSISPPDATTTLIPRPAQIAQSGSNVAASEYATACAFALEDHAPTTPEESIPWEQCLDTLIRGDALRQRMDNTESLAQTNINSAFLCLQHLLDVRLSLASLSGPPTDAEEREHLQTRVIELTNLQRKLREREYTFAIGATPTLALALTHLILGAISLILKKLHNLCPDLFPKSTNLNGLNSSNVHNPLNQGVGIHRLSQAAYDDLELAPGTKPAWLAYLKSSDWVSDIFRGLGAPSNDGKEALKFLIRHVKPLRKTHQEPIKISLIMVLFYLLAGAAMAVFMKYQAPNPFTPANIKSIDKPFSFSALDPVDALVIPPANISMSDTPTISASSSESMSISSSRSQRQTDSETPTRSQKNTVSETETTSQRRTGSQANSASQTNTGSQGETLSQSGSGSNSGSRSQANSASQTNTGSQDKTLSQSGSGSNSGSRSQTNSASQTNTGSQDKTLSQSSSGSNSQGKTITQTTSPSISPTPSSTTIGMWLDNCMLTLTLTCQTIIPSNCIIQGTLGGRLTIAIVNITAGEPPKGIFQLSTYCNHTQCIFPATADDTVYKNQLALTRICGLTANTNIYIESFGIGGAPAHTKSAILFAGRRVAITSPSPDTTIASTEEEHPALKLHN